MSEDPPGSRDRGTVLLTGAAGLIGRVVGPRLEREGWSVRAFDLATGDDLRDEAAVRESARGCDAIVYAGAIPHDSLGSAADIVATNVLGTWHVLLAAEHHGIDRIVFLSSVQVFGFSQGEGVPDYLPVDDDHPVRAARPYGMSKRLGEETCAAWTARTSIPTIVVRPVLVVTDERLRRLDARDLELGAFVHVDDVAEAVVRSLVVPVDGHVRLTLCGPGAYDTSAAQRVLGWEAAGGWPLRRLTARRWWGRSWWRPTVPRRSARAGPANPRSSRRP
jgi:UDP-glucose 4-epimerase